MKDVEEGENEENKQAGREKRQSGPPVVSVVKGLTSALLTKEDVLV